MVSEATTITTKKLCVAQKSNVTTATTTITEKYQGFQKIKQNYLKTLGSIFHSAISIYFFLIYYYENSLVNWRQQRTFDVWKKKRANVVINLGKNWMKFILKLASALDKRASSYTHKRHARNENESEFRLFFTFCK